MGIDRLVAAAIGGALIWFFFQMEKRVGFQSQSESDEDVMDWSDRIEQLPFTLTRSVKNDFRQAALDAAKSKEFGLAVVFLFSHLLLMLDKQGMIGLKKGKTNRQYLRELRQHEHIAAGYQQLMIPFEDHFFGGYEIDQTTYEKCLGNLDHLQSLAKQKLTPAITA